MLQFLIKIGVAGLRHTVDCEYVLSYILRIYFVFVIPSAFSDGDS